jgi:hypothetical protein
VASITETINKMLAQIDEFNVLLESVIIVVCFILIIKSKANGEAMKLALPNLVEQSKQIEKTYAFVDGIGVHFFFDHT